MGAKSRELDVHLQDLWQRLTRLLAVLHCRGGIYYATLYSVRRSVTRHRLFVRQQVLGEDLEVEEQSLTCPFSMASPPTLRLCYLLGANDTTHEPSG